MTSSAPSSLNCSGDKCSSEGYPSTGAGCSTAKPAPPAARTPRHAIPVLVMCKLPRRTNSLSADCSPGSPQGDSVDLRGPGPGRLWSLCRDSAADLQGGDENTKRNSPCVIRSHSCSHTSSSDKSNWSPMHLSYDTHSIPYRRRHDCKD